MTELSPILVTGAAGFVGRHLVSYFLANTSARVVALARSKDGPLAEQPRLDVCRIDLLDQDAVRHTLQAVQPLAIAHLAAQSSVADSLADPSDTLNNNILGQLNLLQAATALPQPARMLVVGSSDEYGLLREPERAQDELTELRPTNPYAVSKVLQDMLAFQYHAAHGLHTVRVRPFSHTGPGHDERFVVPSLAKQIAEIELGLREPVVRIGNPDIRRDFTDVRDMVRAYHLALLHGEPGEVYNLGSGVAHSIQALLEMLIAGSRVPVRVEIDLSRMRPADVPQQLCDPRKFQQLTGWRPLIPIEQTLQDTLDHWRQRVAAKSGGHA